MAHRLTLAALVTLFAAAAAHADSALVKGPAGETICAPRAKLLARLDRGRDFAIRGQGLRDAEAMVEVHADAAGNWILLQSYADGLSCLLAMGEAWENAQSPGDAADASAVEQAQPDTAREAPSAPILPPAGMAARPGPEDPA